MDKKLYDKLIFECVLNTQVNEELFAQWLRRFFYLNQALYKEFDSIYQGSFYIVYYELSTEGITFSKSVLKHIENGENYQKIEFYRELIKGLEDLKSEFSESEFEFIEYKRHSFSHIFQDSYEVRFSDKGKILTNRKGKLIDELSSSFREILMKHGFDRGFDEYFRQKLYAKTSELYNKLNRIKAHYNM